MTAPKTLPVPPVHLSATSREWFIHVVSTWQLEAHHVLLLVGAAEALDRAAEARRAIEADGAYTRNRFGDIRRHPALTVETAAWTTFARLVRELDLDVEPPVEARRPPALRSIRGGGHHAS